MNDTEFGSPVNLNFCFPVRVLHSDRVQLVPFDPNHHAQSLWAASSAPDHTHIWTYSTVPLPFRSSEDFVSWYETEIWSRASSILFVVYSLGPEGSTPKPAGLIGLKNTDAGNQFAEIGYLATFPSFQRTYVTTHAVGLLLTWCLDELGLETMMWYADERNEQAIRVARRVGFAELGNEWRGVLTAIDIGDFTVQGLLAKKQDDRRRLMGLQFRRENWPESKKSITEQMTRR